MKYNLGIGILLGAIAPLIAYLLSTYTALVEKMIPEKPMLVYAVAVFVNLVAIRFLFKGEKQVIAKGILVATFIATILYLFTHRLSI
jgi:predicted tellurium resistance membrane protein TerC